MQKSLKEQRKKIKDKKDKHKNALRMNSMEQLLTRDGLQTIGGVGRYIVDSFNELPLDAQVGAIGYCSNSREFYIRQIYDESLAWVPLCQGSDDDDDPENPKRTSCVVTEYFPGQYKYIPNCSTGVWYGGWHDDHSAKALFRKYAYEGNFYPYWTLDPQGNVIDLTFNKQDYYDLDGFQYGWQPWITPPELREGGGQVCARGTYILGRYGTSKVDRKDIMDFTQGPDDGLITAPDKGFLHPSNKGRDGDLYYSTEYKRFVMRVESYDDFASAISRRPVYNARWVDMPYTYRDISREGLKSYRNIFGLDPDPIHDGNWVHTEVPYPPIPGDLGYDREKKGLHCYHQVEEGEDPEDGWSSIGIFMQDNEADICDFDWHEGDLIYAKNTKRLWLGVKDDASGYVTLDCLNQLIPPIDPS
jgi:hypothetical protein